MSASERAALTCGKVADEVLQTERTYVGHLRNMHSIFYKKLHITCYYPKDQRITSLKHVLTLFSNVEDILLINEELLRELSANADGEDQPLQKAMNVADIFLKMGFALMLYRKYLANYSAACVATPPPAARRSTMPVANLPSLCAGSNEPAAQCAASGRCGWSA